MKKVKSLTFLALAAVLSVASSACQKAENKNSPVNQPVNTSATNINAPANTVAQAPANDPAGSPTDAYKAAYAARKNRDVPALKKLLSKDILEFFTEIAGLGEKKQTVDELLMELCEKPQAATAEVRNEKISGDKAKLEFLDDNGEWSQMEFVKEDGSWKLTFEPEMDGPDDKKAKKK